MTKSQSNTAIGQLQARRSPRSREKSEGPEADSTRQKISLSAPGPGPSVSRRKQLRKEIDGLDVADLLGLVWEAAPEGIGPMPWTKLVLGCIEHGSRISSVDEIQGYAQDAGVREEQLPALTKVPAVTEVLTIEQHNQRIGPEEWTSDGTEVVLVPIAERLADYITDNNGRLQLTPTQIAQAAECLVESGDVSTVEGLFDKNLPTLKTAHQNENDATHRQPTNTATRPQEDRPPRQPRRARQNPTGGGANEVNHFGVGGLFVTPPMSRLSAYRGRFGPDIVAVNRRTVCRIGCTVCGNTGGSGREGRPLERLDTEKEQRLLRRSPLGDVPRVSFPTEEVYERIVEWRPILKWAKPLAAILQLVLISDRRDDNFDPELPCTGMPLWHELVLAAFGFQSRQHAQKHGVNTRMLIELYRQHIDSDFHVSGWNSSKDRARVVLCHSIPIHIIEAVEEHMLGPEEPDNEAEARYLGIEFLDTDREDEMVNAWKRAIDRHGEENLSKAKVHEAIKDYLASGDDQDEDENEDEQSDTEEPERSEVDLAVPASTADQLGLEGDEGEDGRIVSWNGYDHSDFQEIIEHTDPETKTPTNCSEERVLGPKIWRPVSGEEEARALRLERYVEMDDKLDWSEHIWAGTSVGVPYTTDRINALRECSAEVTFVSFEPLIEDIGDVNLDGIDWAIIGGERGAVDPDDSDVPAARELNPEWVRDLIRQCREQTTTVFVKQMGSVWAEENDASDWKGGHPYDWPEDLQIREIPRIYPDQPALDPWP